MVSILLLTIDRFELTKKYVTDNLEKARYPYEFLVCDNGSSDKRVIDFISSLSPSVHILNKKNEGIYSGLNSLLSVAKGDYFVKIDNEISLPVNWLSSFISAYTKIPNAGMAGIHCVGQLPKVKKINGVLVHPNNRTFGTMFWSREVFEKVGYFNEAFNPYGLGDSEYMQRIINSGYINFYLNGKKAAHMGHDVGHDSEYRKNKDESLKKNIVLYDKIFSMYEKIGTSYLPKDNKEFVLNNMKDILA